MRFRTRERDRGRDRERNKPRGKKWRKKDITKTDAKKRSRELATTKHKHFFTMFCP